MTSNAPIFIVGCARSGTSLLRDLLRGHSRLFIGPESHFIPWLYAIYGDPRSTAEASALGSAIVRRLERRRWNTGLVPSDFAHCRSYRSAAELPFVRAAQSAGKPRWGDKTPHYVQFIPELMEIFPDCRIVHIVRDGRDVARSLLRRPFGANTIYHAALAWRRSVTRGLAAAERFGTTVIHRVHYEELVTRPEEQLRHILEFVGEAFEPSVLQHDPMFPSRKRLFRKPYVHPRERAINPQHALKWRNSMSTRHQAIFETVAGDQLRALGYEVRGLARKIRFYEKAWWGVRDKGFRLWHRINHADLGRRYFEEKVIRARASAGGLQIKS